MVSKKKTTRDAKECKKSRDYWQDHFIGQYKRRLNQCPKDSELLPMIFKQEELRDRCIYFVKMSLFWRMFCDYNCKVAHLFDNPYSLSILSHRGTGLAINIKRILSYAGDLTCVRISADVELGNPETDEIDHASIFMDVPWNVVESENKAVITKWLKKYHKSFEDAQIKEIKKQLKSNKRLRGEVQSWLSKE